MLPSFVLEQPVSASPPALCLSGLSAQCVSTKLAVIVRWGVTHPALTLDISVHALNYQSSFSLSLVLSLSLSLSCSLSLSLSCSLSLVLSRARSLSCSLSLSPPTHTYHHTLPGIHTHTHAEPIVSGPFPVFEC